MGLGTGSYMASALPYFKLGLNGLMGSISWCLGPSPKSASRYPREKPHKMDSIGILIELHKQLVLIYTVSSESPTICALLRGKTSSLLQNGSMPASLPVAPRLLGSSCLPHYVNWIMLCPLQHGEVSMATDAHANGSAAKWH